MSVSLNQNWGIKENGLTPWPEKGAKKWWKCPVWTGWVDFSICAREAAYAQRRPLETPTGCSTAMERWHFSFFLQTFNFWWLYFYSFPSVHAIERWRRKSQKWLASSLWQLKKLGKVSKLFCETSSEFNISSEICLKNEYDSPPLCIREYNNNWCWWWWWRWCWRCSGAP